MEREDKEQEREDKFLSSLALSLLPLFLKIISLFPLSLSRSRITPSLSEDHFSFRTLSLFALFLKNCVFRRHRKKRERDLHRRLLTRDLQRSSAKGLDLRCNGLQQTLAHDLLAPRREFQVSPSGGGASHHHQPV